MVSTHPIWQLRRQFLGERFIVVCLFAIVIVAKSKIQRLPKETKARRIWISRLRNVRQNFSAKSGTRVCSLHFKGEEGPKLWCQFPSLFPSKPVQESLLRRNRPLPNRLRGSMISSKVQTCQELAESSSSTKQAVCQALKGK